MNWKPCVSQALRTAPSQVAPEGALELSEAAGVGDGGEDGVAVALLDPLLAGNLIQNDRSVRDIRLGKGGSAGVWGMLY